VETPESPVALIYYVRGQFDLYANLASLLRFVNKINVLVNYPVPRAQGVLVTKKVYGNSSLRQRPQGVLAETYK